MASKNKGRMKNVVPDNAQISITGMGTMTAKKYKEWLAENKPKRVRISIEDRIKFYLGELAKVAEKTHMITPKDLKDANLATKQNFTKADKKTGKLPEKLKNGVSITYLMNNHIIERVSKGHFAFGANADVSADVPHEETLGAEAVEIADEKLKELEDEEPS